MRLPAAGAVLLTLGFPALAAPPAAPASALDRYDLARPSARLVLPFALKEVSGLATTPDGRLFAHDDERAEIHEVDVRSGRIVKSFSFGRRVRGDFEGLAIGKDRFYLVTSDGVLYEGREGADGERVGYTRVDTGFGRSCEIEGLALETDGDTLLLACKHPRLRELRKLVTIFRWSAGKSRPAVADAIHIALAAIADRLGVPAFHASGIERDPVTGHYVLVAAREAALAEVTPAGEVVTVKRLDASLHRKAEGIAFLPDHTLAVGDEAAHDRPRLTLYSPLP